MFPRGPWDRADVPATGGGSCPGGHHRSRGRRPGWFPRGTRRRADQPLEHHPGQPAGGERSDAATAGPDRHRTGRSRQCGDRRGRAANGAEESLGTGWIFDSKGDVVTNAHVINGVDALRVTDRANHTHVARLVQSSASLDLAVIRVSGTLVGTPLPVDPRRTPAVPLAVITLASSRATGQADMTVGAADRPPCQRPALGRAVSRWASPRPRSTTTCST